MTLAPCGFQAGCHHIVFLAKHHLYLVAVSAAGEPPALLRRQLELMYDQVILIVTSSVEKVLDRNPGYDVRHLLAGTFGSFHSLVQVRGSSALFWAPSGLFGVESQRLQHSRVQTLELVSICVPHGHVQLLTFTPLQCRHSVYNQATSFSATSRCTCLLESGSWWPICCPQLSMPTMARRCTPSSQPGIRCDTPTDCPQNIAIATVKSA